MHNYSEMTQALKKDLVYRNVKFTEICCKFKSKQLYEDSKAEFSESFDLFINWALLATKTDMQGTIISSNFKLESKSIEITTIVQTRVEFGRKLKDEEFLTSPVLQILAAELFFPYLTEVIASNTQKMGLTPLTIGYEVLNKIIDKTIEQGGFAKEVEKK